MPDNKFTDIAKAINDLQIPHLFADPSGMDQGSSLVIRINYPFTNYSEALELVYTLRHHTMNTPFIPISGDFHGYEDIVSRTIVQTNKIYRESTLKLAEHKLSERREAISKAITEAIAKDEKKARERGTEVITAPKEADEAKHKKPIEQAYTKTPLYKAEKELYDRINSKNIPGLVCHIVPDPSSPYFTYISFSTTRAFSFNHAREVAEKLTEVTGLKFQESFPREYSREGDLKKAIFTVHARLEKGVEHNYASIEATIEKKGRSISAAISSVQTKLTPPSDKTPKQKRSFVRMTLPDVLPKGHMGPEVQL